MIIYTSEYGTTKKFANQISSSLNCKCYSYNDEKVYDEINIASYIILMSDVIIYKINKGFLGFIKKHLNIILNKKIGIILVCAEPEDTEIQGIPLGKSIYFTRFPQELLDTALIKEAIYGKIDFEISEKHMRMIEIINGQFLIKPFDATPKNNIPKLIEQIKEKLL